MQKKSVCYYFNSILCLLLLIGCSRKESATTPWGTPLDAEGTTENSSGVIPSLEDIQTNGEMIMLTVSGPDTYYDYHGHGMGLQYLLLERFARDIGVTLRVEECRDTAEMVKMLNDGEADIVALPMPHDMKENDRVRFCGAKTNGGQWIVARANTQLADTLDHWYRPDMVAEARNRMNFIFSAASIQRHVYAPVLDRSRGIISKYDGIFQQSAAMAGVDWRLLAAQSYQESCFDHNASSWAGARGLMQIMPTTAMEMGISPNELSNPQINAMTGARYLAQLGRRFRDVPSSEERLNFALASYNGGYNHIRDAMALARKYGRNQYRWQDVSYFVLQLQNPRFYNDPVVRSGYMRGGETTEYVARIRQRYANYCGVATGGSYGFGMSGQLPHRSHHRNKYSVR